MSEVILRYHWFPELSVLTHGFWDAELGREVKDGIFSFLGSSWTDERDVLLLENLWQISWIEDQNWVRS